MVNGWFMSNREIKFRAWNGDKLSNTATLEKLVNSDYYFDVKNVVWMQYTGLKDKNAYEGDVIRDNIGVGVIEYSDKYAGFRVNYTNDRCKWFYDYLDSEMDCLEVIGNIYENPELLNTGGKL